MYGMATQPSISDAVQTSAAGPASMSIDGNSSQEHRLTEQIEAAKFQQAGKSLRRRGFGMLTQKLQPHGSVR
jgi:hypothetical protein